MPIKRTRSELKRINAVHNLRQARDFLALSQAELAEQLPPICRNRKHVSKSSVAMWELGERNMGKPQRDRIAQLIANKLTRRYGREIGIRILANSPWKVTAHYWCNSCRRFHELRRANQKCGKAKQLK